MYPRRVFISRGIVGETIQLTPSDTYHILKVLRLREDAPLEGFDGQGHIYRGNLKILNKTNAFLLVESIETAPKTEGPKVTLVLSLIRSTPMEWALQKCVEMGCDEFKPIVSDFTDQRNAITFIKKRMKRWEKIALESLKQCRRNYAMHIASPVISREFLENSTEKQKFLLHTRGDIKFNEALQEIKTLSTHLIVAIGPEGGWSHEELEIAHRNNFIITTLKGNILRTETAAIAALTIVKLCLPFSKKIKSISSPAP